MLVTALTPALPLIWVLETVFWRQLSPQREAFGFLGWSAAAPVATLLCISGCVMLLRVWIRPTQRHRALHVCALTLWTVLCGGLFALGVEWNSLLPTTLITVWAVLTFVTRMGIELVYPGR
jgi:hypothetical protein